MSTFKGLVREFPGISLDRFDGPNLESVAYFLSHKHADHMHGLDQKQFQLHLEQNPSIKIYMSNITYYLFSVDEKFANILMHMKGLDENQKFRLPIRAGWSRENYEMKVSLLPAGHCAGSVMFLLQDSHYCVLYTGDFRLSRKNLEDFSFLREHPIDVLHVDTTFLNERAYFIPSREVILSAITDKVREWLAISNRHIIELRLPYSLGFETIFQFLSKNCKTKVHVDRQKHAECQGIPALQAATTVDAEAARVHSCSFAKGPGCPVMGGIDPALVLTLKPTAMFFVRENCTHELVCPVDERTYKVCYSTHSSYSEIRDMICYLRPKAVYPNVVECGRSESEYMKILDRFMQLARSPDSAGNLHPVELGVPKLKRRMMAVARDDDDDDNDDCDLDFTIASLGSNPITCQNGPDFAADAEANEGSDSDATYFDGENSPEIIDLTQ